MELNRGQGNGTLITRNQTDNDDSDNEGSDYMPSQGVRVQLGQVQYEQMISPRAAAGHGDFFGAPQMKGNFAMGAMEEDDGFGNNDQ